MVISSQVITICFLSQLLIVSMAVPISSTNMLAAYVAKKVKNLLLTCPLNEGSVFSRLVAEMMVVLQESYISLIVVSSTCSGDIK